MEKWDALTSKYGAVEKFLCEEVKEKGRSIGEVFICDIIDNTDTHEQHMLYPEYSEERSYIKGNITYTVYVGRKNCSCFV